MENKDNITIYKYLFMKYLYKKLDLNNIEQELSKNRINEYENREQYEGLNSKYFILLNNGNFIDFSEKEKLELNKLIQNKFPEKECEMFIEKTYHKFFFSNLTEKYYYYGPISYEYMAPSDAIVLGLCYEKYGAEKNAQDIENEESFLCDLINKIQFELAPSKGLKLAVIEYNEFVINKPAVILK